MAFVGVADSLLDCRVQEFRGVLEGHAALRAVAAAKLLVEFMANSEVNGFSTTPCLVVSWQVEHSNDLSSREFCESPHKT